MSAELPDKEHVELLKKSAQTVGFLTDVIVDEKKPEDILSGRHRIIAIPEWTRRPAKVCSHLHRELIILHANIQRQVPEQVTAHRLLRIARILSTTGGIVNNKVIEPVAKEDVCARLTNPKDPLVPFSDRWVEKCLPDEFKHVEMKRTRTEIAEPLRQIDEAKLTDRDRALLEPFHKVEKDVGMVIKEGLTASKDLTTIYPFAECLCNQCPKKSDCYS